MTSRIERLSVISQVILIISLAVIPTLVIADTASAQTQNQRLVSQIQTLQNINLSSIAPVLALNNLNNQPDMEVEQSAPVPQVNPDIAVLQNYLEQKGSPLAPFAEHILQNENWKLVLAISNGESTLCKHQLYNNCWGIGGAWNLKHYASFAEAFTDVNRLITAKYVAQGADTPQKIVNKYVGHPNANWVSAVNKVLTQLDALPLEN